jgi:hypothetical protein
LPGPYIKDELAVKPKCPKNICEWARPRVTRTRLLGPALVRVNARRRGPSR